ncbi:peptidyl-prolyl cis-trans isomerase [Nostoc sp. FACHB-152]|uniref:foldase protein PrsA n=1 Tax=unclassified Nostoc TaxID=2593658 RepID=UPI001682F7A3|nr:MULTISPECIES: peptidylprolyl isomerase [unclassified Nostoc]MBD2449018.1 peptidyl-prolyl cis-trans isomerase [Nostoc sp. FACHB-152]MBD2469748.1 peptidyl-prolyl cis-trans isomerase [Nostoc sp. FACHB-145]
MTNFDTICFLTVDSQPMSLGQVFGYLQLFGRLQPFVQECLRYRVIYQEIQAREDLRVIASDLAQAVIDFRLRSGLIDPESFGQWLKIQGIDYQTFENQLTISLKLENLKDQLFESEKQAYFNERQKDLEQSDLYYLVIKEERLAYELKEQIKAGKTFEQIAREYPLNSEQKVLVKRDVLPREKIRQEIKTALDTATLKELVGPIAMGKRWCIFQIEQILPAVLDDEIAQKLREELFERWLQIRLQQLNVEPAEIPKDDKDEVLEPVSSI